MLKILLKSLIKRSGFLVMKDHAGFSVDWRLDVENKLSLLDILVKYQIGREGDAFRFLQIGANDGVGSDPLHGLVLKYRLKGTLIEPLPSQYAKLIQNYDGLLDIVKFERLAITSTGKSGEIPFYTFQCNDKNSERLLTGFSSLSMNKLQEVQKENGISASILTIHVPFESVSNYLTRNKINQLSLLVCDAEGFDIELVLAFIAQKVLPNIIYMEILGQLKCEIEKLIDALSRNGYSISANVSDLIAFKE
jgi:FkbM family methyltransferase